LVTLEDILEEIVGDITDEHDVAMPGVRRQPDGSVNVDGAVPIRDLNRVMDWNLPDDEATTIAGLVIHEARSIPEVGKTSRFTGSVSGCCVVRAIASPHCAFNRCREHRLRRLTSKLRFPPARPHGSRVHGCRRRVPLQALD